MKIRGDTIKVRKVNNEMGLLSHKRDNNEVAETLILFKIKISSLYGNGITHFVIKKLLNAPTLSHSSQP